MQKSQSLSDAYITMYLSLPRGLTIIATDPESRPVAALFFGTVFFSCGLFLFLFSLPADKVTAQTAAAAPAANASAPARQLELHVANNGLVLLRSARVTAISGSTLKLSTAWGSVNLLWIVHTNEGRYETHTFGTSFIHRDGSKASLSDVHTGGLVTVTGMLDATATEPTIEADSVRTL